MLQIIYTQKRLDVSKPELIITQEHTISKTYFAYKIELHNFTKMTATTTSYTLV